MPRSISKRSTAIGAVLMLGIFAWAGGAQATQYKVLYSFPGGNAGHFPTSGLVRNKAGFLYGVAGGGMNNAGVFYRLSNAGAETVLYAFGASSTDASGPQAELIMDQQGSFYGTTRFGGTTNNGAVFKISGSGKETILYSFPGGKGAFDPQSRLLMDADGNLFGTTASGGASGLGTVFEVTAGGVGTVVRAFRSNPDGAYPEQSPLTLDAAGNMIGTTAQGGNGRGTVFKIATTGAQTTRYRFGTNTADGSIPNRGVVFDSKGNAYGTASAGIGASGTGGGIVFKLTPGGVESIVYAFAGGSDGFSPNSALAMDAAGNFYGTTSGGGDPSCNCGTVFKVTPAGAKTTLHVFAGNGTDGRSPIGDLAIDSSGYLYGVTYYGGVGSDSGSVFRIVP